MRLSGNATARLGRQLRARLPGLPWCRLDGCGPDASRKAVPALRQWLSLPLATALVAALAAATMLAGALDDGRQPAERAVAPPPPTIAAAPLPELVDLLPEPAAGPPAAAQAMPGDRLAGRRPLPQIPDVPAELDDIARELQRRRTEVLELETALALREAAVRAAEADLRTQVDRLEAYKRELEVLVGEAGADEEERLQQLVRMYESMRAKSAAAIFDRLELPVILAVAKRMREARMAAILAAMDPARARLVTSELAQERELPRLD